MYLTNPAISALSLVALCSFALAAAPMPSGTRTFAFSERLARERNIINDFQLLDLSALSEDGKVWCIAEVTIDPGSYVPTGRLDAGQTGEGRIATSSFLKGRCKILAKLNGDFGKTEWEFNWDGVGIPMGGTRGAAPVHSMPPLRSGIHVMRLDPGQVRERQFAECYELPDGGWIKIVQDASDFCHAHKDLFLPNAAFGSLLPSVKELAANANPLLAANALKTLVRAKQIAPESLQDALKRLPMPAQSVVVSAMLSVCTQQNVDATAAPLLSILDSTAELDDVERLTASVLFTMSPQNAVHRALAKKIYDQAVVKAATVKGNLDTQNRMKNLMDYYEFRFKDSGK